MRRPRISLWVPRAVWCALMFGLVLGCEGKSPVTSVDETYFPVAVGGWWKYVSSPVTDTVVVSISQTEEVGGIPCWKSVRYRVSSPGDSSVAYLAKSDEGIEVQSAVDGNPWFGVEGGRSYIAPEAFPMLWLKLPVAIGETWVVAQVDTGDLGLDIDGDGIDDTYSVSYSKTASSLETVRIPGIGDFESCLKVTSLIGVTVHVQGYQEVTPYELTEWYAEGVGLIKRRFQWVSSPTGGPVEEILSSYGTGDASD